MTVSDSWKLPTPEDNIANCWGGVKEEIETVIVEDPIKIKTFDIHNNYAGGTSITSWFEGML